MAGEDICFDTQTAFSILISEYSKSFLILLNASAPVFVLIRINDLALLDLDEEWTVDSNDFVSMGKATPFDGWKLQGKNVLTICKGEIVYEAL